MDKKFKKRNEAELLTYLINCSEEERNVFFDEINEERMNSFDKMGNLIREGKKYIFPERHEAWVKAVRESFYSFYCGKDIEVALDIIKQIEAKKTTEIVDRFAYKDYTPNFIDSVRYLVLYFSKDGASFFKETCGLYLNKKEYKLVCDMKQNNAELTEKYYQDDQKHHTKINSSVVKSIKETFGKLCDIDMLEGIFVEACFDKEDGIKKFYVTLVHSNDLDYDYRKAVKDRIEKLNSNSKRIHYSLKDICNYFTMFMDSEEIWDAKSLAEGYIIYDKNGELAKDKDRIVNQYNIHGFNDKCYIDNIEESGLYHLVTDAKKVVEDENKKAIEQ